MLPVSCLDPCLYLCWGRDGKSIIWANNRHQTGAKLEVRTRMWFIKSTGEAVRPKGNITKMGLCFADITKVHFKEVTDIK